MSDDTVDSTDALLPPDFESPPALLIPTVPPDAEAVELTAPPDDSDDPVSPDRSGQNTAPRSTSGGLQVTTLSDVQMKPIDWDVPGYVARGKLTLIAGEGGEGKTTMCLDYVARKTTGRPQFGLEYHAGPPGNALILSCEDDLADSTAPSLHAAGADLSRVQHAKAIMGKDGKPESFNLKHYEHLRQHLAENRATELVVIDPVAAFVGGIDDYRDNELRAVLTPLGDLAAEFGVTVLLIKHLNKNGKARAIDRIAGSVGYVNACRAVYLVVREGEHQNRRLLLPAKFNIGQKPSGLEFGTEQLPDDQTAKLLDGVQGLSENDRRALQRQLFGIRWFGISNRTADEVMAANQPGKRGGKQHQAEEWLCGQLSDGPVPSLAIDERAAAAGIAKRTLDRAKKDAGVHAGRSTDGHWELSMTPDRSLEAAGQPVCNPIEEGAEAA